MDGLGLEDVVLKIKGGERDGVEMPTRYWCGPENARQQVNTTHVERKNEILHSTGHGMDM